MLQIFEGGLILYVRKSLSEVGFEPTPTFVDQNAPLSSKEETVLLSLAP